MTDESIFCAALEKSSPQERRAYLDAQCDGDEHLRARVERLLAAHGRPDSLLDERLGPDRSTSSPVVKGIEAPGMKIGPYKLLQEIGEGGFGVVYMAEQTRPVRRKVALKIIKAGMDTKEIVARFEAERQALALMDHPNIAKVFDGGATEAGRPYFVMELVKGIPLTSFCDENKLDTERRLKLFAEVCRAIQHAHHKGVIHRDVKPSNVLVTLHDGVPVPKVIDFGVSKAISQQLTEKTLFTAYGQMVGTPQYMSPEQAELSGLDIDTRTDIFSLGVVLYELLTGTTPLDGKALREKAYAEIQRMICETEPPKPSTRLSTLGQASTKIAADRGVNPHRLGVLLRGELDWIVMRALDKDRNRRYETANALAADVERFLNNESVEACPPSLGYKFRKFARRNKAVLATAGSIAVVLVAASILSIVMARRAILAEQTAKAAEDEARTEAQISKAVVDFLQSDLLAQADSATEPDADIKLRTVLDRAAENIEGKFPDQPLVEAAIRRTIGTTYRSMGHYGESFPHLRRAYELHQGVLGEEHLETLTSKHMLAEYYALSQQLETAEALHREVFDTLYRTTPSELTWVHRAAVFALRRVYNRRGKYKEELQVVRQLWEIQKDALGAEHDDTKFTRNIMGQAYMHLGRYEQAEPLILQYYKDAKAQHGMLHEQTLHRVSVLGELHFARGRYHDAQSAFAQVVENCEKLQKEPLLARGLRELGETNARLGRLEEAETQLKRAFDISSRARGAEHRRTLHVYKALAYLRILQGDFPEAHRLLDEAIEIGSRTLSEDHPGTVLSSKHFLGRLYMALGEYKPAEELLHDVLAAWERNFGPEFGVNHPHRLAAMQSLSELYLAQHRLNQAERLIDEVLPAQQRVLRANHPDTLITLRTKADLHRLLGEYGDAERVLFDVIDAQTKELGKLHFETLTSQHSLAKVYLAQGDADKAGPLLATVLDERRKIFGDDHPDTRSAREALESLRD